MNNKQSLHFFEKMAQDVKDENCVKLANNQDYSHIDAEFILNYANKNTKILDLGSGTGLIINKIHKKVGHIDAVELFENFTQYITKSNNISIHHSNTFDFIPTQNYDLITLFGFMHYLNQEEASIIYNKYFSYLNEKGILIVKNQMGVHEDLIIDGYSEEQKSHYSAHYRHVVKEVELLLQVGFKKVSVHDIYPAKANRWDNTHFYALVAIK